MLKVIFIGVLIVFFSCSSKQEEKYINLDTLKQEEKYINIDTLLPAFHLLLIDSSTIFNTSNIKTAGKNTVLFYFSPICPNSRALTKTLLNNITSMRDVQFYFFTNLSFPELKAFYSRYQLTKYSNITVGMDYKSFFAEHFKVKYVPWLMFYNQDRKLKKIIVGNTDIKLIREVINL